MAVRYTELEGSPQCQGSREEFTATMELKVDWGDVFDVLQYFGNITPPLLLYPHMPFMGATVESIGCQPFGNKVSNAGGLAAHESAQITVNWSNKMDSNTLCVESIEPSAEFLTLDPSYFEWTDGTAVKEGEEGGILLQSLVYEIEYPRRLTVPSGFIPATGCVNAAAWSTLTLGLTFAAETLLYTPRRCTRIFSTAGAEAYSLGMSFAFRPSGWNTWWRPQTAQWAQLRLKDGGAIYKSYPTYNFNLLR